VRHVRLVPTDRQRGIIGQRTDCGDSDILRQLSNLDHNHIADRSVTHLGHFTTRLLRIQSFVEAFNESAEKVLNNSSILGRITAEFLGNVGPSTHLRLSFLMHPLVMRLMDGAKPTGIMETTLVELL